MIPESISRRIIGRLMPRPIEARDAKYSMIFSVDDDKSQPSKHLVSIALEAIRIAETLSLDDVSARMKNPPYYPNIYPGEHYKLLAGLVSVLKPKVVVEIGTYTGLSALSMKKFLPQQSKIVTFDLVDWKSIPESCLKEDDFRDGKLVQYLGDLGNPSVFSKYRELLQQAELIFVDAAKDEVLEPNLLENFKTISFDVKPLIVFDDIRLWKMLKFWRNVSLPKLDLTSFGHWAGTGIVEWE